MLACVFTLGISFNENYQLMNLRDAGTTANTYLNNPTQKQISEIKNLNITDSIGKEITVGNVDSNKLKKNEQNIVLEYIDKEAWEKQIKPAVGDIKGSYPEKENEIMLSQSVIDLLKLKNIEPGDKIVLNCNINKKINEQAKIATILENDIQENVKTLVEKLNLKNAEKILNLNWKKVRTEKQNLHTVGKNQELIIRKIQWQG